MFKKLKKKIEEGEEVGTGGLEKLAFAPRKLPGLVVRSSPSLADGESKPFPVLSEGQGESTVLNVSREAEVEDPERSGREDELQEEDREPKMPVGLSGLELAWM